MLLSAAVGLTLAVTGVVASPVAAAPGAAGAAGGAVAVGTAAVRADDGARVVSEQRVDDRTIDVTIASPAVGRNVTTRLLLPAGWNNKTHRNWPVLYLLHGCCGAETYRSWTEHTDVAKFTAKTPAMIVMPDSDRVGFYSNWWNHGKFGAPAWERFHLVELRQILERGYGAGKRRVVAGLSMGGFGALSYAGRHPDLFRAAASYSGVTDTLYRDETGNAPDLLLGIVKQYSPDPYALWGDPVKQRNIWAAHNPRSLLPQLRHTPIYVSAGNGQAGELDPPGTPVDQLENQLYRETVPFNEHARKLNVPLTTDMYGAGTHSWPYWERALHRSFPILARGMGVPAPPT